MKTTTRIALAAVLVLFGSAAWPFADGFEARAACQPATTLDLGDGLKPVLLVAGSSVCVDAAKATAKCQRDAIGVCKREASPLPPVPPPPACPQLPAGYSYLNDGDNRALTYKSIAFGATYPAGPTFLAPVGSFSSRSRFNRSGQDIAGKVISVPVTMTAANRTIQWLEAQPVSAASYNPGMVATSVTVVVDRCKGVIAYDRYKHCGAREYSGSLVYGPTASDPKCRFPAGTPLYITVSFPDPAVPLDPSKNSCSPRNQSSGKKCDANFTFR